MFRDNIDGQTLHFDLAGLNGSNFVMRDSQTRSEWQQATGESIAGPLKGKRLALVPFILTTWGEWRKKHPDTVAFLPEAEHAADYQMMESNAAGRPPTVGKGPPGRLVIGDWSGAAAPSQWGIQQDTRLPTHEQVMGIDVGGSQKAYPLSVLAKQTVLNDLVGRTPVLVIHSPQTDTTTVYSRRIGDRTLTFRAAKPVDTDVLIDRETGSQWDRYGECLGGKMKGRKLEAIIPLPSFWFSWAGFYPKTKVYFAAKDAPVAR